MALLTAATVLPSDGLRVRVLADRLPHLGSTQGVQDCRIQKAHKVTVRQRRPCFSCPTLRWDTFNFWSIQELTGNTVCMFP